MGRGAGRKIGDSTGRGDIRLAVRLSVNAMPPERSLKNLVLKKHHSQIEEHYTLPIEPP
jgi:hypothetical protein